VKSVKPVLQAILLADRVYQDAATGKKIIAGTFNRLFFKRHVKAKESEIQGQKAFEIPGGVHAGSPYAFVSLTEVIGKLECILQYVDLKNDKPLIQCSFTVESNDPLQNLELVIPLPPLPTLSAGIHALELLCDGELVGSHRIIVQELGDDTDH
jgi:hypothetical protein